MPVLVPLNKGAETGLENNTLENNILIRLSMLGSDTHWHGILPNRNIRQNKNKNNHDDRWILAMYFANYLSTPVPCMFDQEMK